MNLPLILVLVVATGLAADRTPTLPTVPPAQQAQKPVTAKDIEHFVNVAFGDFAARGKRRMAAWQDSAGVSISRDIADADRQIVNAVIAEINQHAGRTIYYLTNGVPDVELQFVSAKEFASIVPRNPDNLHSVTRSFRVRPTGHIERVVLVTRSDRPNEMKTWSTRLLLAKSMGLMFLPLDRSRSLFHGTKPSLHFEDIDKVALRLQAEHASLAGMSADAVEKALKERYLTPK